MCCQNPGNNFGSKTMHAQFSSQNLFMCPVTNSDLIRRTWMIQRRFSQTRYWSWLQCRQCGTHGPTCVLVILNGCPTNSEPSMPFKRLCMAYAFFPERLFFHCQGLCCTSPSTAEHLMHAQCSFVKSIAKLYHARFMTQIKECKTLHTCPAAWNFVYWLQRYATTIICCCIALLEQLVYRWQHQSRKLWIQPHISIALCQF
jgi:hypothetical protein